MIRMPLMFSLRDVSNIESETPREKIWEYLLRFGDRRFLETYWQNVLDSAYDSVSTLIKQAHEFRQASKYVTLLTRPLLLYYSFLNLAKAVVWLTTNAEPEHAGYHGLCKHEFGAELLEMFAFTNKGVFGDLSDSLGTHPALKKKYTLLDFIKNVVELKHSYEQYYNTGTKYVVVKYEAHHDGELLITIPWLERYPGGSAELNQDLQNATDILNDFKILNLTDSDCVLRGEIEVQKKMEETISKARTIAQKHFDFCVYDNTPFLNLYPAEDRLMPELGCLGAMFLLSSLVRYAPSEVDRYLRTTKTSEEWFINRICDECERVFPNLMLNVIHQTTMVFGSRKI